MIAHDLPWLMSAISLYSIFLTGNKARKTWLITLGNQGLWFIWIFTMRSWGLLPLTIGISILAIRNWIKWGAS